MIGAEAKQRSFAAVDFRRVFAAPKARRANKKQVRSDEFRNTNLRFIFVTSRLVVCLPPFRRHRNKTRPIRKNVGIRNYWRQEKKQTAARFLFWRLARFATRSWRASCASGFQVRARTSHGSACIAFAICSLHSQQQTRNQIILTLRLRAELLARIAEQKSNCFSADF